MYRCRDTLYIFAYILYVYIVNIYVSFPYIYKRSPHHSSPTIFLYVLSNSNNDILGRTRTHYKNLLFLIIGRKPRTVLFIDGDLP